MVEHAQSGAGPLLLEQTIRPQQLGEASGDSATSDRQAEPEAMPASRVPSRSNTWVTSGRTPGARPSPVTQRTPVGAELGQARQLLFEDQPVAVAAREGHQSDAAGLTDERPSWAGGKSGRDWCSPTSSASQDAAMIATTFLDDRRSNGRTVRSDRTRCSTSRDQAPGRRGPIHPRPVHGTASSRSANTHRNGPSSQDSSAFTPPHGPYTIRFGHASRRGASACSTSCLGCIDRTYPARRPSC